MARRELIESTAAGIFCPQGGFFIDPRRRVPRALITHAHSDHARRGCGAYLCAAPGENLLRRRLGPDARIESVPYGRTTTIGGVRVTFHPAGHVLGSAQIHVEAGGDSWTISGDYKTEPDPTCAPFEPVRCRTFLTESTFALPVYRWRPAAAIFDDVHAWWRANRERERTSVVLAYALGKAQRILNGLDPHEGPIFVHAAVEKLLDPYRDAGVGFPAVRPLAGEAGRALVIAPPSAATEARTRWRGRGGTSIALASGWMATRGAIRRRAVDAGFAISDHADWNGILRAIDATGAERIAVTHGFVAPLVRWLREHGRHAFAFGTADGLAEAV